MFRAEFQRNAIFRNPGKCGRFSPRYAPVHHQSLRSHRPLLCYHPPTLLSNYQSSGTILLPYSLTTSPFSPFPTSSQLTPLPIIFLTAFDSPPFSTVCFPSLLPQTIPPISRCICLPLSLQMLSSYQSTLAYVSLVIRCSHLEGPGLKRLHHNVHSCVDCIVGFSDRNSIGGLCWCRGLFARDYWEVCH